MEDLKVSLYYVTFQMNKIERETVCATKEELMQVLSAIYFLMEKSDIVIVRASFTFTKLNGDKSIAFEKIFEGGEKEVGRLV